MNVIKRNGSEVKFNKKKIIDAVTKAMKNCNIKDEDFVLQIADSIEGRNQKVITVEDIQDLIENKLMASKYKNVAQQYIRYRYERERIRHSNTTDDAILSLIEQDNELLKQENSNKNPTIISTQRDYMAGEVSKDLTNRIFLPQDIVEAHKKGLIHFHDADYFAQHCHNCFVRGTKFITVDGTKSFYDFQDNDVIEVFDKFGNIQKATVHYFGIQPVYEYTLRNGKTNIQKIQATEDHKWFLHNDKITTNLKIGDKLLKAPKMFQFDLNYSKLTMEEKIMWCKGFGLGNGTVEYQGKNQKSNRTRIRLCGTKDLQYLNRFKEIGCTISSQNFENGDKIVIIHNYHKEIPNFNTIKELLCFFNGLYCADGKVSITKGCNKRVYRIQSSNAEVIDFIRKYAECIGLYITSENDLTGEKTNFTDSRPYTILFSFNPDFSYHYKVIDKQYIGEEPVWCLTVENTHSFILSGGIPTGNCDLVNLEDMLQNGTVINGTLVEKPHSFSTACNIATQIMAQVASSQYGGQSISLTHLAPFVNVSREKIRQEIDDEWANIPETSEIKEHKKEIVENRVRKEIEKGVQTMQYQINTLMTTNGQSPFVTLFMYLNETDDPQIKEDLALIIEEVVKQRYVGTKNEKGVYVTPAFPKLIYVLEEDNIHENSKYYYLTELCAKCTARRLVPDYISEKVMKQLKQDEDGNGYCYPVMGCRSALTVWRDNDKKAKFYGRFNQGVVTVNLVDIGLSAHKDMDEFWKIFDERMELCHRALRCRHERLKGTISDVAPVLWQYGALTRLQKGEVIDEYLYGGYSTLSLGYAGLWECVYSLIEKKLTEPEGEELGLQIMRKLNEYTNKWKKEENIAYSLYGTPLESTTYKFAQCLQKRFGIIEGVTDKDYITNSYHVHVTEPIDAFSKLKLEAKFQALSPGGAISYVEVPNMENNIDAVLTIIKFIYDNIMYAELNTKSDYCQVCGYNGEIEIVEDENEKLIWKCPNCGNTDQNKMNVARRTCGYIGSNFWNQGRTQEIKERVLHVGDGN